ncbi:30S ribosomal protein S6 [Bienertia sinuspersici]
MSQLKQSLEQLKSKITNLKPELSATEVIKLEEELKALTSEKDGELEYMQSLQCQLEKLKDFVTSHLKCIETLKVRFSKQQQ